jgi:hypothetical protein
MMGVIEFGEALLRAGDLDPIYTMLHESQFPARQKERFCVAYWLFYHAGVAASASEKAHGDFWRFLEDGLEQFPRGTERRHFRGAKAKTALERLYTRYPLPEWFPRFIRTGILAGSGTLGLIGRGNPGPKSLPDPPISFTMVSVRTQTHAQFGPWIAFKVADMMERVLGVPIDFADCALLDLYEEPRKGATLAGVHLGAVTPNEALEKLLEHFNRWTAPPNSSRMINVQEVETILCKWKAHRNGFYPLGKDTREVIHALHGWGDSAEQLRKIMQARFPTRSLF